MTDAVGGAKGAGGLRGNVAAIDCGTLSTRLLVVGADGKPLERRAQITRLGEGVDAERRLLPAAMGRTLDALAGYGALMHRHGVAAVRMVGTSALRDAVNRDDLMAAAHALVGAPLELLSGAEEAALSLAGATSQLDLSEGPWMMVDIGGGSTELAVTEPSAAVSLDIGCVRLSERFLVGPAGHDATGARLEEARRQVEDTLAATSLPPARRLVGLAGTVSALARWAQGLAEHDSARVHHYRLSRAACSDALAQLASMTVEQRAALPGIEPARAPHIVAGTLVLDTVMAHFGFTECLVSEADILDGLVLALLAEASED